MAILCRCPPAATGTENKIELAVRQYRTPTEHCYFTLYDTKTGQDVAGVQGLSVNEAVDAPTTADCRVLLHQPVMDVVEVVDDASDK